MSCFLASKILSFIYKFLFFFPVLLVLIAIRSFIIPSTIPSSSRPYYYSSVAYNNISLIVSTGLERTASVMLIVSALLLCVSLIVLLVSVNSSLLKFLKYVLLKSN